MIGQFLGCHLTERQLAGVELCRGVHDRVLRFLGGPNVFRFRLRSVPPLAQEGLRSGYPFVSAELFHRPRVDDGSGVRVVLLVEQVGGRVIPIRVLARMFDAENNPAGR